MHQSQYQHGKEKGYKARLLLWFLLSCDFIATLIHIVRHTLYKDNPIWITHLTAWMDTYHLIKLFPVIILFTYFLYQSRCFGFIAWVLVFTCLFLDDMLLIHQNIGNIIATWFNLHFHLGYQIPPRLFEYIILGIAAILVGLIVSWAYLHSGSSFRKISQDMLLFIMALLIFGLIVDLADAINLSPSAIFLLGFVEDSGENVVLSITIWYVFLAAINNGEPVIFLCERICKRKTSEPS